MKTFIIFFLSLLLFLTSLSNDNNNTIISNDNNNTIISRNEMMSRSDLDTIKAIILITECDTCQAKSIKGYVVTNKYSISFGYYHEIIEYLDSNKNIFSDNITVWLSNTR